MTAHTKDAEELGFDRERLETAAISILNREVFVAGTSRTARAIIQAFLDLLDRYDDAMEQLTETENEREEAVEEMSRLSADLAGYIDAAEAAEADRIKGEEPPEWAKDCWNHDSAARCGDCGGWLTVVRPGKTQCDNAPCNEEEENDD